MKNALANYFHFSRAERHGAIALGLLCAAVFLVPEITRHFQASHATDFSAFAAEAQAFHEALSSAQVPASQPFIFDPNTASVDDFVRLGLSERIAKMICKYRDKGGAFRRAEDFGKIYSLPRADFERLLPFVRIGGGVPGHNGSENERATATAPELFDFDPNTASADQLRRLGLSARIVSNILKFREKGGSFRVREDFRKLYGLSEQDFARLEPYIFLPVAQAGPAVRPVSYAAGSGARQRYTPPVIDVNTATVADWQELPGIGEGRARQITAFRDKLGGFVSLAQVAETRGLPDSIFQQIQPFLKLETPVFQQINLNTATVAELDAHPYVSFKQADLIVNYRTQHGPYGAVDELAKIAVFKDGVWLTRIKPYFAVR